MTGIAAILSEKPDLAEQLAGMMADLQRHPHDDFGQKVLGNWAVGACDLHTTGQSRHDPQPLANSDHSVLLALDGYLTNYEELERDFEQRGLALRTRSDAELVLLAYELWGEECVQRIEGEFAFVLIDRRNQRLFCARDHQGLRPLYYWHDGNEFLAASSLSALIKGIGRQPEFNFEYLAQVMVGTVYCADQTCWKGIKRLPTAHALCVANGKAQLRRYYDLPIIRRRAYKSDAEYVEEYKAVLIDSLRRTSRTDGPLAFEVSGGLDSSALFCLAHAMYENSGLLAPSVAGYTMRGERGTPADEIEYARSVADFLGVELSEHDLFRPELDWFTKQAHDERDLPNYTNIAHSLLMDRAMAKSGSRVVINGLGGDQWLDGALNYYDQNLRALQFGRLIENIRRDASIFGSGKVIRFAIKKALLTLLPDQLRPALQAMKAGYFDHIAQEIQYLLPSMAESVAVARHRYLAELPAEPSQRTSRQKLDQINGQRGFDLVYRQHAALGLETRSPMFTRQFIEFSHALPDDLKLRGGRTKWIHREAMRGLMPDAVIDRDDKAHFPERKHDHAIAKFCRSFDSHALRQLVNSDRLHAFIDHRISEDVDDFSAWPYWSVYSVMAFLDAHEPKS